MNSIAFAIALFLFAMQRAFSAIAEVFGECVEFVDRAAYNKDNNPRPYCISAPDGAAAVGCFALKPLSMLEFLKSDFYAIVSNYCLVRVPGNRSHRKIAKNPIAATSYEFTHFTKFSG